MQAEPSPRPALWRLPLTWVRQLYEWTLSWAETRFGMPALFVLAFFEASFFPIPPDVLLMPLVLGKRSRAFLYAGVCTLGSVSGACLGWYIGSSVWASLGEAAACAEFGGGAFFFEHIPGFKCERFAKVQELYAENAWMALFVSAFTPIPYKIFTVAAGVFKIGIPTLIFASAVGRGARFFLVAGLLWKFGAPIKSFIEKRFELLTFVFAALLIGGFAALKYVL